MGMQMYLRKRDRSFNIVSHNREYSELWLFSSGHGGRANLYPRTHLHRRIHRVGAHARTLLSPNR